MRRALVALILLAGCARVPRGLAVRDPRLSDEQRTWLVDAEDEVAIAQARIEDAKVAQVSQREHHRALIDRFRAAEADLGPWNALGRAREAVVNRDHRRALARLDHAQSRLRLVRAEVATNADLAVVKLEPLRNEVARHRDRLAKLTREVEQAHAEAEDRADEAWASWRKHLVTSDAVGAFWQGPDAPPPDDHGDAVADTE